VLTDAARQAERLGFDAVWSAERVVQPWSIDTPYPYGEDGAFIVPPDRPFLDAMTCLAFLSGRTERVRLGVSVLVLPYRHPLYWARVAASLDLLSSGRFILGVGVGWMAEEFEALGAPFAERGRMSDEQLEILRRLRAEERAGFEGRHYRFHDVSFHPKAPAMPVWVGGEGRAARRRAGRFGDAWFPYFVRITPAELGRLHQEVRDHAREAGRDPDGVALTVCRSIELTPGAVAVEPDRLRGSPEQLAEALRSHAEAGVSHLALQFTARRWPERTEQIERFAAEVMPALSE
jgi:probable F420-dependent oxidoreductase